VSFECLSICNGARWECRPATRDEIVTYPRAQDIKDKCNAVKNEEFTTCESTEPVTCKVSSIDRHERKIVIMMTIITEYARTSVAQ
jgi:hypothetical protein